MVTTVIHSCQRNINFMGLKFWPGVILGGKRKSNDLQLLLYFASDFNRTSSCPREPNASKRMAVFMLRETYKTIKWHLHNNQIELNLMKLKNPCWNSKFVPSIWRHPALFVLRMSVYAVIECTHWLCVNVRGRAGAGRRQQRHTLVSSNRPKKKKKKHTRTHLNGLMGLCQTHHISQLLCGLNYDDIIVRLQMHKNVYLASSLWARTFLNPFASHHRER